MKIKLVFIVGHIIDGISELPLVVSDNIEKFKKTKQAVLFLRRSKIWADVLKVSFIFFKEKCNEEPCGVLKSVLIFLSEF